LSPKRPRERCSWLFEGRISGLIRRPSSRYPRRLARCCRSRRCPLYVAFPTQVRQRAKYEKCQIPEVAIYSITSSARASSISGMSSLNEHAVCRLMTNSNLVDCRTGRSVGFAPLRMLTQSPAALASSLDRIPAATTARSQVMGPWSSAQH